MTALYQCVDRHLETFAAVQVPIAATTSVSVTILVDGGR